MGFRILTVVLYTLVFLSTIGMDVIDNIAWCIVNYTTDLSVEDSFGRELEFVPFDWRTIPHNKDLGE